MPDKARVVVRGNNIFKPPLLITEDAHIIEYYDTFNDLMALNVSLGEGLWSLVTKDSPDWPATLVRHGYMSVNRPAQDIIMNGL